MTSFELSRMPPRQTAVVQLGLAAAGVLVIFCLLYLFPAILNGILAGLGAVLHPKRLASAIVGALAPNDHDAAIGTVRRIDLILAALLIYTMVKLAIMVGRSLRNTAAAAIPARKWATVPATEPLKPRRYPVPLAAVVVFADEVHKKYHNGKSKPTAIPEARGPYLSMMMPYGIVPTVTKAAFLIGTLLAIALIGDVRSSPMKFVGLFFIVLFVWGLSWLPMALVVRAPAQPPLDRYISEAALSERPSLIEGAGLLHPYDYGRVKVQRPRFFSIFFRGLQYGLLPLRFSPARLQSLIRFRRNNLQRILLSLAIERTLIGRQENADIQPRNRRPFTNVRFLCFYYGHVFVLYACIVAVILVAAHVHLPGGQSADSCVDIIVTALFAWWAYVVWYSLVTVTGEIGLLEANLTALDTYLPASVEHERVSDALYEMLQLAETQWMPTIISLSSAILLIAALTAIQALGVEHF